MLEENVNKSVALIFEQKPETWGLRGDPYLWEEMKSIFSELPFETSREDFVKAYTIAFERLTGKSLEEDNIIYLSRHAHGGMSSGQISVSYWRETLLPMLLARLENRDPLH